MKSIYYARSKTGLAALLLLLSLNSYGTELAQITACDKLAGDADDPEHVGEGIKWEDINAGKALKVCQKLSAKNPSARILYQTIRADYKLHENDSEYLKREILPALIKLGERGHLQSSFVAATILSDRLPEYKINNVSSYKKAGDLFVKAEELPASLYELAEMYSAGKLHDPKKSEIEHHQNIHELYVKAAKLGDRKSAHIAGMNLLLGRRYLTRDPEKAFREFLLPNANRGDMDSIHEVGKFLLTQDDPAARQQGQDALFDLANKNHLPSIKFLAAKLRELDNIDTSVEMLKKGIALDDNESRLALANIYLNQWRDKENNFKTAESILVSAQKTGDWNAKYELARLYADLNAFKPIKSVELFEELKASIDDIPFGWDPGVSTKEQAREELLNTLQSNIDRVRTITLTLPNKHTVDNEILKYIEKMPCSNCSESDYPYSLELRVVGLFETLKSVGARELTGSSIAMKLVEKKDYYVYQVTSLDGVNYSFSPHFMKTIADKKYAHGFLTTKKHTGYVEQDGGLEVSLLFRDPSISNLVPYKNESVNATCEISLSCRYSAGEEYVAIASGGKLRPLRCDKSDTGEYQITRQLQFNLEPNKKLAESQKTTIYISSKYDGYTGESVCYMSP